MSDLGVPVGRVALATRLLVAGLLVSAVTLAWQSPLSFLAFAGLGVTLTAAGVAVFIWTIVVRSVSNPTGG